MPSQQIPMPDVEEYSPLQRLRISTPVPLSPALAPDAVQEVKFGDPTTAAADVEAIQKLFPNTYGQPFAEFVTTGENPTKRQRGNSGKATSRAQSAKPLRIGCVLSGGQASGGHNVIAGLYDAAKAFAHDSEVYGFLNGPHGVMNGNYVELDDLRINAYRNMGGFDMIGSGRHKIETPDQFAASAKHCSDLKLDGLVVIGGDDSNTNAALLAEYFKANGVATCVAGCPKTIDGDLKNEQVEVSFGFDTACKTYSELIGNLMMDTAASRKYYHFIRLMGRSASHITLECALETCPNMTLIGEEEEANNSTLESIVDRICDVIVKRSDASKDFGVILVPEGLIEFIPEVGTLIKELNEVLADNAQVDDVVPKLTEPSAALFNILPEAIRNQMMLDRDPHGNVQVSRIETEALLIMMVETELQARKAAGRYSGTFASQAHFFGYEGRAGMPSDFDAKYCYGLGFTACSLIKHGLTGYMANLRNLRLSESQWIAGGAPITMMMNVERRHGKDKPVIRKALTELDGAPLKVFQEIREYWELNDCYSTPGPIQLHGDTANSPNYTLMYEQGGATVTLHQKAPGLAVQGGRFLNHSNVQAARVGYHPPLPQVLQSEFTCVQRPGIAAYSSTKGDQSAEALLRETFPCTFNQNAVELVPGSWPKERTKLKIGVVFCGRQTPGGHNVVGGLLDAAQKHHPDSEVLGFMGGTKALFDMQYQTIETSTLRFFRSQGGIDMIGRSVDKISTPQHFEQARKACQTLQLDGLALIGGTISMTHAAMLAEDFAKQGCNTSVVGIPGSVDGDLKSNRIDTIFGFDTACKVYSQLIGNMCADCNSAKKYYYFVRLMGRSPSHITLECALQTHPNVVLIGEEIAAHTQTLADVVNGIADVVCKRREAGKNYGVVVIPEGCINSITDLKLLLKEIGGMFAAGTPTEEIPAKLTAWSSALFQSLPEETQKEFMLDRESGGSVQLSQIQTEKLIAHAVGVELKKRSEAGAYEGGYSPLTHYFGYQARSAMPSNFDATLANCLAHTAVALTAAGATGLMVNARRLAGPVAEWKLEGLPLVDLMTVKREPNKEPTPLIAGAEVSLEGDAMRLLNQVREKWAVHEAYRNPGPVQYDGPVANDINLTLQLERESYASRLKEVEEHCSRILELCRSGCPPRSLATACSGLGHVVHVLELLADN
jgi:6-phosphofructokinase 1